MFVASLSIDDETVVGEPTVEDVEAAVRSLDGVQRTLVTLAGPPPAWMGIGGGAEGQFVVFATFDNEAFEQVVSPTSGIETICLVAGGQPGDYPRRHVVTFDAALQAATTFAAEGSLAPTLVWERT